jgi:leucyl aminopeptidase
VKYDLVKRLQDLEANTVLSCPFFEDDTLEDVSDLRQIGGDRLDAMLDRGEVRSKRYEVSFLPAGSESLGLLLIGAGDHKTWSPLYLSRLAATASRHLTGRGYTRVAFVDRANTSTTEFVHAVIEGALRGAYNPELKKTKPEEYRRLDRVTLVSDRVSAEDLETAGMVGRTVGEASTIARDLVNMPPNELTPSSFAAHAQRLAEECGLECEVLGETAMRQEGMGALLGVTSGSDEPPRLIVLRYGEQSASVRLALVGKGLTFDSGGLSLKTHEGMETMKSDMGGGAAVIAGMVAIARLAPQHISVTGYVGAVENMPGGQAMRPGDVLTAITGETIEVLNTDAEGRLVLADVLALAVRDRPTHLVDFATLTGGAVVALGDAASLATGEPAEWVADVVQAADAGMERAWQMPLYPEYRLAMESDIADVKNIGGRWGSALTAAAFLRDFVGEVPWAHLDIAGTAFAETRTPYRPKGGTGEGVATIVSLVRRLSAQVG